MLVVIVAQGARQFVVVHVVLVLAEAPQLGHLLGVDELELALVVGPGDDLLVLLRVHQQLEQELPQSDIGLHLGVEFWACSLVSFLSKSG